MSDDKKIPLCFRCVHLHNTCEKIPGTDFPFFRCLMVQAEITEEYFAVDCNKFYTANMDD